MRSLPIALAAALLAGPVSGQQVAVPLVKKTVMTPPERCNPTADKTGYLKKAPPSLKLGDQPPANHFYAVYNVVDGCPQPIVLRKGIGANLEKAVPVLRVPPKVTRTK